MGRGDGASQRNAILNRFLPASARANSPPEQEIWPTTNVWDLGVFGDQAGSVSHRRGCLPEPDGEGWREADIRPGPITLGHRRLAVKDTSAAGAQPMPNDECRYWLAFNGMVYNHEELREELIRLGHHFRGHADGEALLAAYAEWGEACLNRFNGMIAIVIWDAETRRLFAARDRFGVKPL